MVSVLLESTLIVSVKHFFLLTVLKSCFVCRLIFLALTAIFTETVFRVACNEQLPGPFPNVHRAICNKAIKPDLLC